MLFRRFFQSSPLVRFRVNEALTSNQSLLSRLRKKTGYAITNCKKALEINNNNIEEVMCALHQAEQWLNAQAQAQGWAKAAKLQSRSTPNGLVGMLLNENSAVMVEVNCETDFVARNEKFQTLVSQITEVCFKNSLKLASTTSLSENEALVKIGYSSEQLGVLKMNDNASQTLSDLLALNIGQIGENMSIRRSAALFSNNNKTKFACCTHPQQTYGNIFIGKYAAVIAYEENLPTLENQELPENIDVVKLPKQLCQHIIGMNPLTVNRTESKSDETNEEETALSHQEFLSNPEYTVNEILTQVGWELKDFLRFECGESIVENISSK